VQQLITQHGKLLEGGNWGIMPANRLLTTVLQAFQGPPDPQQTNRILSSTASLLTTLSNPLNVTLLTSQLLTAPAIWNQVDGLDTSLRIISIFNTAAIAVRKHQLEGHDVPHDAYQPRQGGGLKCDDWAKAVIKGADDRSARWQHLLVIGGVLLGMEGQGRRGLSRSLRTTIEGAIVTAANLALEDPANTGPFGRDSIVLTLNHTFPLLSDLVRSGLNYDVLVMVLLNAMTSMEGYQDCYFLGAIDYDVRQVSGNKFDWSANSPSFLQLQKVSSRPLIQSMGPLSRLIAHSIEHMNNSLRIVEIREHLFSFADKILALWQQNKLSEIDPSEEEAFLTPETLKVTFPAFWQVLKTAMFATVVVLSAVIRRTLIDRALGGTLAAVTASKSLMILRRIHFISSRQGSNAFSAYTFVNLTSIDILSRHVLESKEFLESIYPPQAGQIPANPLQRNLDLFYLNTVEHFTLILSPPDSESLVVKPSLPYIDPTANAHLREIFEAAHSAMLSVLAVPQNADLAARILPLYVESLFGSFPTNLSPRQFIFAFKALVQVTTPPSPLSSSHPILSETLLELLHHRALNAPTVPLPASVAVKSESDVQDAQPPLSEQAVLLLTLLDALPNLTIPVLEEWLPLTTDLLNAVQDGPMREHCKARFWEVLESGEMDVERSAVCVTWWTTRGGRERVLFGDVNAGPFMSGALGDSRRDGSHL
jgi:hypothetical protein